MLEKSVLYRPPSLETTTSWSSMIPLRLGDRDGVDFDVFVAALGGTNPMLRLKVEHSVDRIDWETSEDAVDIASTGVYVVRRLNLYEWVRLSHVLTGTTPTATYGVRVTGLEDAGYPTITVSFDGPPQQGGTAAFSGTTGTPGAIVQWTIEYSPSGQDSDTTYADVDGEYTGTSTVPGDAEEATISVVSLGQTVEDTTPVNP